MTEEEILRAIHQLARRDLDWRGPDPATESRLVEDLEMDSLQLLTLAVAVENRFEIRLSEEDEAAIETVGDLVSAVRRRLGDAAGGAGTR